MSDTITCTFMITIEEDTAFQQGAKQHFFSCMEAIVGAKEHITAFEQWADGWMLTYRGTFEDAYALKRMLSKSTVSVKLEVK